MIFPRGKLHFFQDTTDQGEHFQKRTIKHQEKVFLFEHGGSKVRKREWNFVRKDGTQISGQKGGSGDETTLIGVCPCRRSHNTIFTTHAIWLLATLSG